jgi:hypothetical protein
MFGTDHSSSLPLLVHRVCQGFQHCIPSANFKLVMHSNTSSVVGRQSMEAAKDFLNAVGVGFTSAVGVFTSNFKMMSSLRLLSKLPIPVSDPMSSRVGPVGDTVTYGRGLRGTIYHTDLDEVPDSSLFSQALLEMQRGDCDAIRGYWIERVSRSGQPQAITLSAQSLTEQYPFRCNISAQFMPARTTVKIIAYRPNYRLVSGQHDLWCNLPREVVKGSGWDQGIACRAHIRARQDKSTPMKDIFLLLPKPGLPPRICPTQVPIDHYKFVAGVEDSLKRRVTTYRELNFVWWKQSNELLRLIQQNQGRIDLTNPEFNCKLA